MRPILTVGEMQGVFCFLSILVWYFTLNLAVRQQRAFASISLNVRRPSSPV